MTFEEFEHWKKNNPSEYEQVFIETIELWKRDYNKENHSIDDVVFMCPSVNKDEQVYTYRRIFKALENRNDCCDDLVKMMREYILYREKNNNLK